MIKPRKPRLNRRQQQPYNFSSFSSVRLNLLQWGAIAGATGGFLLIQPQILGQIVGIFVMVFIADYKISKAAQHIPLWQAIFASLIGILAAIMGVITAGTLIVIYFQTTGG